MISNSFEAIDLFLLRLILLTNYLSKQIRRKQLLKGKQLDELRRN